MNTFYFVLDNLAGFPMSSLLRGVGAHIGRNGRMLACQSLTRLSETASGSSLDRLYWRALLQVRVKVLELIFNVACRLMM